MTEEESTVQTTEQKEMTDGPAEIENQAVPVVSEPDENQTDKPDDESEPAVNEPETVSNEIKTEDKPKSCIVLQNVSSCAQKRAENGELEPVLIDVDLEVFPGEIWGIGADEPSHAELALEIIGNMRPYYSGRSRVGEIGTMREKGTILAQMFYIDTPDMIYPNMNVLEQLMFVTDPISGKRESERQKDLLDLLVKTGFSHIALSLGADLLDDEKMLFTLLVAALSSSSIIAFNIAGHTFTQEEIIWLGKIIHFIREQKKTLVIATSQPRLIGMNCDHVLFLHQGRTRFYGSVDDLNRKADTVVCSIQDPDILRIAELLSQNMEGFETEIQGRNLYLHNRTGYEWSPKELYELLASKDVYPEQVRMNRRGRIENAFMELMLQNDL